MKNKKQSIKMGFTSFIIAATLLACNTIVEPVAAIDPSIDPVQPAISTNTEIMKAYANSTFVVAGDTIVPKRIAKLPTEPSGTVDLMALKNKLDATLADKPLRMVSIGGSLASGMRDGGLTQESQLTSYPNLIARQMKLTSFKQPLFADSEFNGFGYKLPKASNTAVPRFNAVKNNMAVKNIDIYNNVTLNNYVGDALNNYAIPYLGNLVNSNVKEKSINSVFPYAPYLYRINKEKTIKEALSNQNYDIITIDNNTDYYIRSAYFGSGGSGSLMNMDVPMFNPFLQFLIDLKKNSTKVLMTNIPNIYDFPYFQSITLEKIKKATQAPNIYYRKYATSNEAYIADESIMFSPNATLDSLMNPLVKTGKRGLSKAFPLEEKDVFTNDEIINSAWKLESDFYVKWLKENGFSYVDIESLYKKIVTETYTSDDGAKVSSKEFFSTDGINPTALGQAIIANEFIKTMNTAYKSNIPLINIVAYKK